MDDLELLNTGYFGSTISAGSRDYSASILPMIEEFDLVKLMSNPCRGDQFDNGGFLVLTDHQYIVGYNLEFGMRSHELSFACITGELLRRSESIGPHNCFQEYDTCVSTYFTASIHCEERNYFMSFNLCELQDDGSYQMKKITNGQLEAFKNFYDKYNETISRFKLPVSARIIRDKEPFTTIFEDLTPVLNMMETMVDKDKKIPELPEGERIIGVPNKIDEKRLRMGKTA